MSKESIDEKFGSDDETPFAVMHAYKELTEGLPPRPGQQVSMNRADFEICYARLKYLEQQNGKL